MTNLDEAIAFVEQQLESDGEQKQSFNSCKHIQFKVRPHHYGKCELIKLLSYIYEVPEIDVNIKK